MIHSKEDLKEYLNADKEALSIIDRNKPGFGDLI